MFDWFFEKLQRGVQAAFVRAVHGAFAELVGESPPLVIDAESSAPGGKTRERLPSAGGNGKTKARAKRRAAVV